MMWIEYLRELEGNFNFQEPASKKQLTEAQEALGIKFPSELSNILGATNGVVGEYGDDHLWSLKEIVKTNRQFRKTAAFKKLYMPFDHLLFFGASGGGDQYFFPIDADGLIRRLAVFRWAHETDGRVWAASSLKMYFQWISDGTIQD